MKLTFSKKLISVSLAKIEDAKLLLKIHNASISGGFFKSKNLIIYKDHIEWLKKKLKSNSKIYIGKNSSKKKFGYVRFDEVKNNIFEVSLGNLANFYGKGLGSSMLEKSIKKFKKNYKPKKIISAVKKFNTRSVKCFLKNDFVKVKFDKKKHYTINKLNTKKEYYLEFK
tara:strand:+ start:1285 stop:1791 length:507 start_codon:yes stop_codon:yes gene_type:complete